jgi:hypothetical protein
MDIAKQLNRDYYIKMRIKGYSHESLIANVFPPERTEKFVSDVNDLKDIDFTKKVNIENLVKNSNLETKSTSKQTSNKSSQKKKK